MDYILSNIEWKGDDIEFYELLIYMIFKLPDLNEPYIYIYTDIQKNIL
jgi:hypothetical protein